uniref:Uncharacterized protein n=1 Tax=Setaria viridis TaxID=4556 RepID=A0A4U6V8D3_SETVI|nr:hypothetical protein SEVIR_3G125701v2 [Setaria viridis]
MTRNLSGEGSPPKPIARALPMASRRLFPRHARAVIRERERSPLFPSHLLSIQRGEVRRSATPRGGDAARPVCGLDLEPSRRLESRRGGAAAAGDSCRRRRHWKRIRRGRQEADNPSRQAVPSTR